MLGLLTQILSELQNAIPLPVVGCSYITKTPVVLGILSLLVLSFNSTVGVSVSITVIGNFVEPFVSTKLEGRSVEFIRRKVG